jgi:virginiamycin A acetyltransferase
MAGAFPNPDLRHPVTLPDGTRHAGTVFLSAVLEHPNIEVGAYTYASAFDPPADGAGWAARLAPYLFPGAEERLRIGRFCQIADGVRFVTSGANHATRSLTTYPFPIFDPEDIAGFRPDTRDTVIGHDCWFGQGAVICPGARIGSGVIVGAGAVVRGTIPDYAVVIGNPGRVLRLRFEPDEIGRLLSLAWWDWPADRIARARPALMAGDVAALARA